VAAPTPVQPPPPAAVAPTAPAAPVAPTPEVDPQWLPKRLERERAAALKAAGFDSPEAARAAADAIKAKADADKSAEQRANEAAALAASEKARADSLLAVTKEHAARMMVGLTPEQKAAVDALAGDDPAKQLQAITTLAPTWAKNAPPAPPAPQPGATTAPPAGAPNGNTPPPSDERGQYESARSSNPFAAASFGLSHPKIYDQKK
jgi:hypothetical protein